ncbi:hypothetical protein ACFQ26_16625 [Roseovarius aestuarii]
MEYPALMILPNCASRSKKKPSCVWVSGKSEWLFSLLRANRAKDGNQMDEYIIRARNVCREILNADQNTNGAGFAGARSI